MEILENMKQVQEPTLMQRIHAVMTEVQYLNKDKTVSTGRDGGSYRALSDEKVTGNIREAMVRHRIAMYPIKQTIERVDEPTTNGRYNRLTTVQVTYRVVNIDDTRDYIDVVSCGTGVDTQDKGSGKALTYSRKNCLINLFLVPSGLDSDNISSEEYTEKLEDETERATLLAIIGTMLEGNEGLRQDINEKMHGAPIESLATDRLRNVKRYIIAEKFKREQCGTEAE